MNLKNFLTLTIQNLDFNLVAERPDLVEKLRELTLEPRSGLNHELNWMLKAAPNRKINCQILLAYRFDKLLGWALLSKEDTDFCFTRSYEGFNSEDGWLFQVYIDPAHRRQGIASELYKRALKITQNDTVCICPWDEQSAGFYSAFPDQKNKWL